MDYKNIVVLMVGALVGVLILSAFVPIISATQENVGEPITKTNTNYYHYSYELTDNPVVFKMKVGEDNARTYYINGEEYNQDTFTSMNSIVSDGLIVLVPKSGTVTSWGYTYTSVEGTQTVKYISEGDSGVSFENGVIYALDSNDDKTEIGAYTWVIYNNNDSGDWVLLTQTRVDEFYIKTDADIIAGGYYSTGDLDTYYTFKDGIANATETGYTASALYDKVLTSGTTDIYTVSNFEIEITDGVDTETFVPYWFFVKESVNGHQTAGAMYEIYGLLPLIAGLGLLLMVCYEVFRRYI